MCANIEVIGSRPELLLDNHPEAFYALPEQYQADGVLLFSVVNGTLLADLDIGGRYRYDKKRGWLL